MTDYVVQYRYPYLGTDKDEWVTAGSYKNGLKALEHELDLCKNQVELHGETIFVRMLKDGVPNACRMATGGNHYQGYLMSLECNNISQKSIDKLDRYGWVYDPNMNRVFKDLYFFSEFMLSVFDLNHNGFEVNLSNNEWTISEQ